MLKFIIFFACVILSVVIGEKRKINAGLIAFAFAFILGFLFLDMNPSKIVNNFPLSLFFNIMITTLFYAFAASTGAMEVLAKHILYAFRNARWAIGLALYLAIFIVSALGAGAAATAVIMSPFAFAIAAQMGYNPILASVSVWAASAAGSGAVWGTNTATMMGLFEPYVEGNVLTNYVNLTFMWKIILYTGFYLILYIFFKGYKCKDVDIVIEKPQPMNAIQKKSMYIIFIVIILMMFPPIIHMLAPNPVTKWMKTYLTIQSLASFGIVANMLLNIGKVQDIIKNKVPWNMIITVGGMATLMGLTEEMGVAEILSNWLVNLPSFFVLPGLVLITSILSFFVSAYVINPLFAPLMTTLMAAAGVPFEAVGIAFAMGAFASSISPFSTGGAMALVGCTDEEVRQKLVKQQIILSFISMAYFVIISATGVFSLFALK